MSRPVSLRGHHHVCPACDPGPRPHVSGPVVSTRQSFLTVDGTPVATVGDACLCSGVPTRDPIAGGSGIASIEGRAVARQGDPCSHGGRLVQGVAWLTFG